MGVTLTVTSATALTMTMNLMEAFSCLRVRVRQEHSTDTRILGTILLTGFCLIHILLQVRIFQIVIE